jgi:hypothetical protein
LKALYRRLDSWLLSLYFPVGEFVRMKRKTDLGNVIGQRKKSPRKSWISFYFFKVRAKKIRLVENGL